MAWVHKVSNFQRSSIYIIVIKTMSDATGDKIRELKIMTRLIDIKTLYTRTGPCLTELKLFYSYLNRIGRMASCTAVY